MNKSIFSAPVCHLKSMNNLFIELTSKNCNMRCKHCYIEFSNNKNIKDFININLIKENLLKIDTNKLKCIYLTGAEPMTHPDFNSILRMCLKVANVCIITNGSYINEKKSRFLKRVEEESNNEIIIQLSLTHFDELKNDEVRSRGAFRQTLNAIKSLVKYGFSPIIVFTNYYCENNELIVQKVKELCIKADYPINASYIKINNYTDKENECGSLSSNWNSIDCEYGRILTNNGVYVCPYLANDHRGRCGSDLNDFSEKMILETNFCENCIKNPEMMFGIDFEKLSFR